MAPWGWMGEHGIQMAMSTGEVGKAEDKSEWLGAPIVGSMGTTGRTPRKGVGCGSKCSPKGQFCRNNCKQELVCKPDFKG